MGNFGSGNNVSFSDGLQSVDSLSILLLDLHDLSKAPLPNHLQQFKILNLQCACSILNVLHPNAKLSGAVLNIHPVCSRLTKAPLLSFMLSQRLLPVLSAQFRVVFKFGADLIKSRHDASNTEEDILASSRAWGGIWVS